MDHSFINNAARTAASSWRLAYIFTSFKPLPFHASPLKSDICVHACTNDARKDDFPLTCNAVTQIKVLKRCWKSSAERRWVRTFLELDMGGTMMPGAGQPSASTDDPYVTRLNGRNFSSRKCQKDCANEALAESELDEDTNGVGRMGPSPAVAHALSRGPFAFKGAFAHTRGQSAAINRALVVPSHDEYVWLTVWQTHLWSFLYVNKLKVSPAMYVGCSNPQSVHCCFKCCMHKADWNFMQRLIVKMISNRIWHSSEIQNFDPCHHTTLISIVPIVLLYNGYWSESPWLIFEGNLES